MQKPPENPIDQPPSPPDSDWGDIGPPPGSPPEREKGGAFEIYGDETGGQEPTRPRKRPVDPD